MATTNETPNGKYVDTLLFIYLVLILIAIFSATSCKSPEKIMDKAYKTVSTDPAPATEKRKAQLASWVAANFPVRELVVEKEVVVKEIDTTQYVKFRSYIAFLNNQLSLVGCPEINSDSLFKVAKESIKPEVIIKTKTKEIISLDTTGNWLKKQKEIELLGIIGRLNAEKQGLSSKLEQSEIKSANKDKWLWYFIASLVVLILSHILRSKLSLPIKLPVLK